MWSRLVADFHFFTNGAISFDKKETIDNISKFKRRGYEAVRLLSGVRDQAKKCQMRQRFLEGCRDCSCCGCGV